MSVLNLLLDCVLAVLILLLALRAVLVGGLYQSAVTFIAFGLTLALAWARLAAPDVALAEAAIGAGLLGVLLIHSLRDFEPSGGGSVMDGSTERGDSPQAPVGGPSGPEPRGKRFWGVPKPEGVVFSKPALQTAMVLLGTGVFAGFLLTAVWGMPVGGGLTAASAEALERSGVEHPVTAVLLNFRSYDTWLEVGVLLIAMLAIFCAGGFEGFRRGEVSTERDLLIDRLARLLAPVMVLVAGYLLWLGKAYPGGAFQAGVVLGAAGILLQLAGWHFVEAMPRWVWKLGLAIGFAFFLLAGIGFMVLDRAFLEYPAAHAGWLILWVEAFATLSIGLTLTCFFVYFTGMAQAPELGWKGGGRDGNS